MHIAANFTTVLVGAVVAVAVTGCQCGEGTLSRLGETERTIAIGESFVATYETGGSYCNAGAFAPAANVTEWRTTDTATIALDRFTGRITGKRVGDALVTPTIAVTAGSSSLLVHVR